MLSSCCVLPEIAVSNLEHALPTARALLAGGVRAMEISIHTPVGLAAIEAIRKTLPQAIVAAGGLTRAVDFAAGGAAHLLRQFAATFADAMFCPGGGLEPASAADFLSHPNVICIAAGWLAPPAMMQAHAWGGIEAAARRAVALRAA